MHEIIQDQDTDTANKIRREKLIYLLKEFDILINKFEERGNLNISEETRTKI